MKRPPMHIDDYTPVDCFVDLRNFKLSKSEFRQIWNIQLFFKRMQDCREYHKKYNSIQWKQAIMMSADLQMFLLQRLKPGHCYE